MYVCLLLARIERTCYTAKNKIMKKQN